MSLLRDLRRRKKQLTSELNSVQKQIDAKMPLTRLQCKSCVKKTLVGKLVYQEVYVYIKPYSCSAGGYWTHSHDKWECPKCGANNSLWLEKFREYDSSEERAEKQAVNKPVERIIRLKPYFQKVIKVK